MSELLVKHILTHAKLLPWEKEHIVSAFKRKQVKKNEFILLAGNVCRYENFIIQGCFKMYSINAFGKEEVTLLGIEQWYISDLYSFLSGKQSVYNIKALEDGEILQISRAGLEELLEKIPALERYFRILFQNAFVNMQVRMMENIHNDAQGRYRSFLDRFPGFHSRVPQYVIASYLGITPQFLSRIRKKIFSQTALN